MKFVAIILVMWFFITRRGVLALQRFLVAAASLLMTSFEDLPLFLNADLCFKKWNLTVS